MNKPSFQATACFVFFAILLLTLLAASSPVFAQSDQGLAARQFGKGQPQTINDLPPGQLKRRLESLPPQARVKALKWLQNIDFTGTDLDLLKVDDKGGVYFEDTVLPDQEPSERAEGAEGAAAASAETLANAFLLHSRPGAPNVVFLDFDGHSFSNTAWGEGTYNALPYDLDSDPSSFNNSERTKIVDIWHRVAEDLAPFNIDVTTEEPASFNRYTGRLLITRSQTDSGPMPSSGGGGVAYVNVFGASDYHTYYSPALVYYDNLGNGFEGFVAEAASHEFGHNLGLSHDGTLSGSAYYSGHGSGLVSWAPIMGVGYYNNVTQWSKGEYADANQLQDDIAIITGKLSLAADDHGNTYAGGTALLVDGNGLVFSSNPELDPNNELPENKGIIHTSSDVDVFTFSTGAGSVSLTVTPAWDAFYRASNYRGANLDIKAELRTSAGTLVASNDPTNNTSATVSATVAAGSYQLIVSGIGNSVVPYTNYGSHGQYFINGSVATTAGDNVPPTPSSMTWASTPTAIGENAISMTATAAVDETSSVQYRFNCTVGGSGCVNSAWQASKSYTASGLAPATSYTFTVIARDLAGNQTGSSSPASATTDTPPPPQPAYVNIVADSDTPVSGSSSGGLSGTFADDGSAQIITEQETGGKSTGRVSYLEHRWSFDVSSGSSVTVFANAWSSGSSEGDTFDFQYSLDGGGSWSQLFNVSSTSQANTASKVIPNAPSGSMLVRVVDSNRTPGTRELNSVNVDHLYIQVANPPSNSPDGAPASLNATAVSSSQINLSWNDNSSNETAFKVERSANGTSGWSQIANLPVNSTSYSNTGLQASTTYYYRVSAYNANGSSAFTSANASTQSPPQTPAAPSNLVANGYKKKGVLTIGLQWTGAASADVYRDGQKIANGVASPYTDVTGAKGSGSFSHKVCVAGSTSNCSGVTTTTF